MRISDWSSDVCSSDRHDSAEAVLAPVGECTAHPGIGTITAIDAVVEIFRSDDHFDLAARNICLRSRTARLGRKEALARRVVIAAGKARHFHSSVDRKSVV